MTTASISVDETRRIYPDAMRVRDARARYFERNGFDETTYIEPFVRIPFGPVAVYMPNIAARREAVKVHDLHHLVTGYGTDWPGEFEESAFELGAGIGRYWFGWFINVGGVTGGVLKNREQVMQAFARGRRAKRSLYHHVDRWNDAVLDDTVGSLREVMQLDDAPVVTAADRRAVWALAVVGLFAHLLLPLAAVVGVAAAIVTAAF